MCVTMEYNSIFIKAGSEIYRVAELNYPSHEVQQKMEKGWHVKTYQTCEMMNS